MKGIATIFAREMRSYFVSPVAYTIFVAFLGLSGWYFYNLLTHFLLLTANVTEQAIQLQQPPPIINVNLGVMRPWFLFTGQLLLFLAPIITMRLLAEERGTGRLDMLLAAPVSDSHLLLGKYLAGVTLCALFLVPTLLYPGLLLAYGNPETGQIIAGYIGLMFLSLALIALGLAVSALTANAVVAAAGGFGISILFWLLGMVAGGEETRWGIVFSYLSLLEHYGDFASGVLETRHLVYYLSFVAFLLFLALQAIRSQRWRG